MQFCSVVLLMLNQTAVVPGGGRGVMQHQGDSPVRRPSPPSPSSAHSAKNVTDLCHMCFGRSLCLLNSVGAISCFCPPDYTGQLCQEPLFNLFKEREQDACKNGGILVRGEAGALHCVCPHNYAGADCSRVAVWTEVEGFLYADGRRIHPSKFNLSNPSIDDHLCNLLSRTVRSGPMPRIATSLLECRLKEKKMVTGEHLRVIARFKFDPGSTPSVFQEQHLRRQLKEGSSLPYHTGIDFAESANPSVKVVNLCETGEHDCAYWSRCVWDGVTYSCQCSSLFSDGAIPGKLLPGRYCYYAAWGAYILGVCTVLVIAVISVFFCTCC